MGGRGRGRGRGRGANSNFGEWKTGDDPAGDELLLRPPFYPDLLWRADGSSSAPWTGEVSTTLIRPQRMNPTLRIMKKQREFRTRWTEAASYIEPTKPFDVLLDVPTMKGKSKSSTAPDEEFWKSLSATNAKLKTDTRYFPSELVHNKRERGSSRSNNIASLYSQFADASESESEDGQEKVDDEDNPQEEEEDDDEEVPDDEEVGADYTQNHYDSDVESDGGNDDEPMF